MELCATFISHTDRRKRCEICKKESKRHPKGENFSLDRKGCKKMISNIVYKIPEISNMPSINFYRCPINFINYKCTSLINQNQKFNSGIMPYSGGFDEQPAKFVELMSIIDNLFQQHEESVKKNLERINGKRSTNSNNNS